MERGPKYIFFQKRQTDGQQTQEKMPNITNHQGNANQNHNDTIISYQFEWLISKRQITSVGEEVEKKEPLCTTGGNDIGAATVANSTEVPQKIKNRSTM